ncbi:LysR family transcriptional regulator [Roseomonas sp. HJA6]|uniref:LysR family transcriptional regulator n=1 Tax=Roseomonas alba TaxID=2846776 RepID=A0ABS7AH05_9PROT|nr:LysR substrate-binding domain-containing protein [Neoroseomonas alba]MBW6401593.1 LysR family transcriptional regulator [Neoroseomonas alba]
MLAIPPGIDPDLLRSFVLIAEGGSFTRAANAVGRTQSAVSMQIRRLEETLGQPLLLRGPRGVETTPHGAWLLERARRLLAMHDEIVSTFRTPAVSGTVRLGTPDDYALRWLPGILARFAEVHPAVEVVVTCAPSNELVQRLEEDEIDLTLLSGGNERPGMTGQPLWHAGLRWIGSTAHAAHRRSPIPLATAQPSCVWRRAAVRALDEAGLPWRVAYTSTSQAGTLAPALAGLAVTIGLPGPLPAGLRFLGAEDGMPPLPDFAIVLVTGPGGGPVVETLAEAIRAGFAEATVTQA